MKLSYPTLDSTGTVPQWMQDISNAQYADENQYVDSILADFNEATVTQLNITHNATRWVEKTREIQGEQTLSMDNFLATYDLSNQEGIALMCVAEALLRIPDTETADKLIQDKIGSANWRAHMGESDKLFVNAATWGLMLTGKIVSENNLDSEQGWEVFKKLVNKLGEPVIRQSVKQAMRFLGQHFVMGETIEQALKQSEDKDEKKFLHSYDMLGEAAKTLADAQHYYSEYEHAIHAIGKTATSTDPRVNPGISIKLSALHPRYEVAKADRMRIELVPKVIKLAQLAKQYHLGLTIDAEEANRLILSLDIIYEVASDPSLKDWNGLGLAVQAYQKTASQVIATLAVWGRQLHRRFMVRLVKGAYWDSEIKYAQQMGYKNYPVFTRKMTTDVHYIYCAKKLLADKEVFYPQFATHNARTLATILEEVGQYRDFDFEFQRLYGMGQALYETVLTELPNVKCRVYAPVGGYQHLLAYLVRRLLENGANTSFVHQIVNKKMPVYELVADPVVRLKALKHKAHVAIPTPPYLYGKERLNSAGTDLCNAVQCETLLNDINIALKKKWQARPLLGEDIAVDTARKVFSPNQRSEYIGDVYDGGVEHVDAALRIASAAFEGWDTTPLKQRADLLRAMGDALETHQAELIALAVIEAGKTIPNAIGEVREAVDFCRYYAALSEREMGTPITFVGPTGESDQLSWQGRGIAVCISPWNFPLAIFTGQVAAALVTGNPVIAKPAEQTPLIAAYAVELFHQAGVAREVLQFIPGPGETVGARLTADPRVASVIFTGSTETAWLINQSLAQRKSAIATLIAETGGQNAMIVDSSALLEQVVTDVVTSAFDSAGQRCSALRVLCIQDDIADNCIKMLQGAMAELTLGDPLYLKNDVGPVIDAQAQQQLLAHIDKMKANAKLVYQCEMPATLQSETFVAPVAFEIESLQVLTKEVFGPVLHIVRYRRDDLSKILQEIYATGFGLTFGMHSRISRSIQKVIAQLRIGNIYINRNMVGAVVGVQPFGGQGLSGTGPKAGGPGYLHRLVTERTISINTVAFGGNTALLSLKDDDDVSR